MPAPIDPQMLQMLLTAAKQKQAQMAPQIALTPNDMSPAEKEQKAMGLGLLDPTVPVQGGAPGQGTAPAITPDEAAANAAEAARAKGQMPAPAPAPVAPGGQLGPGVTMDPQVTIKPTPPQAVLEQAPSRSDMPDPHAPEPQDEEPDDDEDDLGDASSMPFRFAV